MSLLPPGEVLASVFDVREKVVLVTGGASGLGLAIARVPAECGASVVIAERDEARLAASASGHPAGAVNRAGPPGRPGRRGGQLSRGWRRRPLRQARRGVRQRGIALGRGPGDRSGLIETFDLSQWREALEVNLHGVVHTVRAAAAPMKQQRSGSIIVTASSAGLRQDPYVGYSYIVAKAGIINLVRQAALDLARWQVRVHAIAPGPFRTNLGGGARSPEAEARWAAAVPLGRMGDPAEIRGLALLLASSASTFMTGAVYSVDGGQLLLQSPALGPIG